MPSALESKSIKEQLILALKNLSELQDDSKFLSLISRLESPEIIIPENKHTLDLLKFTYLLVCQYPEILSAPEAKPLRKLCQDKVKEFLATPSEEASLTSSTHKKING